MTDQSSKDFSEDQQLSGESFEDIDIFEDIEEALADDFLQLLSNAPIEQTLDQAMPPAKIYLDPDFQPITDQSALSANHSSRLSSDTLFSSSSSQTISEMSESLHQRETQIRTPRENIDHNDSFFDKIYDSVSIRQQPVQQAEPVLYNLKEEIDKPDYSNILIADMGSHAAGTPSDPALINGNFWHSWHLTGEYGLNVQDVWLEYTGAGIDVAVFDDGVNRTHSELSANYDTSRDYDTLDNDNDAISTTEEDSHGTRVSMMIAADDNGSQSVGVAYDSTIIGLRRGYNDQTDTADTLEGFERALSADVDIMNNSWGTTAAFGDHVDGSNGDVHPAMVDLVQNGRDGLGTAIVFSAGNSNEHGQSANYKNYQNSIHTITVGASSEDGTIASFSEWGSNVLLSAPGEEVRLPYTLEGYAIDDNGTSFSAPAVSGVIALMLEANPDLGYRDIQEILAVSSRQTDLAGGGWQTNGDTHWNGGGMTFSHDFGFGIADAHAAVRIAETWTKQQIYTNMTSTSNFDGGSVAIPSSGTVTTQITVNQDIEIEHAVVYLDINHARSGDLVISLISPDGTESILVDRIDNGTYTDFYGIRDGFWFDFSSVAHWGETSQGTWTLEIQDVVSGNSGTLNDWDLQFFGSAISTDDTYTYTEDFSLFAGSLGSRATLNDTNGGTDNINASAVTSNTTIDLESGTATIDGQSITVSGIEDVYTGDGDDTITGDDSANHIWGGRGADIIDGGEGDDTAEWLHAIDDYSFDLNDNVISVIRDSVEDLISNIETFVFDGTSYLRNEILSIIFDEQGNEAPVLSVSNITLGAEQTALASSIISAVDADGHTLTYTVNDGNADAGSGHFQLDGQALAAGQDHELTAEQFATLQLVGGTESSSDTLTISVTDGVLSDTETVTLTTEISNTPPALTATNTSIVSGQSTLASAVFSVNDEINDGLTYFIIDHSADADSAYLQLDGQTLAAQTVHELTQEEFDDLLIIGGSADFVENISLQVADGLYISDWTDASITTAYDDAPTLSTNDTTLPNNSFVFASTIIHATDSDSANLTYTISDDNTDAGSAYLYLNGQVLAAGQDHELTAAEFNNLYIYSAQSSDTDEFTVTVSDGNSTTDSSSFTLTSLSVPTITTQDVSLSVNQTTLASNAITANDTDGDELTYFVLDTSNHANSGYFELGGEELAAKQSHELSAAEFATLLIVGGSADYIDNLWVQATDGNYSTGWARFKLTTALNETPDLSVDDTTIDAGSFVFASSLITASDPDNDALTYTINDGNSNAGSASLVLDGVTLNANEDHELSQYEVNRLRIVGGTGSATDEITVQISDGSLSSSEETITFTTNAANMTPTISAPSSSVVIDESILASEVITANDSDGDELTYYIIDKSADANSAYFELSSIELAAQTVHELTAAEFATLEIIGGSAEFSEIFSVYVSDGNNTSPWRSFRFNTTDDEAPTLTADDFSIQANENLYIADNITVGDADTKFELLTFTVSDNTGGSGYFELRGVALAEEQDHVLSAADFGRLRFISGSDPDTDSITIAVSDGSTSVEDTFTITTTADNTAPTVTRQFNYIEDGASAKAEGILTGYDADGDALGYYILDQNGDATSAYFTLDGIELAANQSHYIAAEDIADLAIVGGSAVLDERIMIQVTDGEEFTRWERFDIRTRTDSDLTGDHNANALIGGDSENVLSGERGNDILAGQDGRDTLTGGKGSDTFLFESDSAFNDTDVITDFRTSQGDALDISDLLVGYDPDQDAIDQFIQITDNGTDSTLSVDVNGGGDNFQVVATLTNVTGLTDEDSLLSNGNIIA